MRGRSLQPVRGVWMPVLAVLLAAIPVGTSAQQPAGGRGQPAKGSALDIPSIATVEVRALGWLASLSLARSARLGPLYGSSQGVQNSRLEPYSGPTPQPARATAAVDLTGTWVSVITEEWVSRMVTPRKGYFRGGGIHVTPEGVRLANMWDPAKDEAAGETCKGYGAVGVTRLPGKVRVTWQDDNTLKVEFEAGNQIRLFHFGDAPAPSGPPSWQGHSVAQWERAVSAPGQREGNLRVVTTHLRPQYARKNGLPVSGNAKLTEYLQVLNAPHGDLWLSWIGELDEALYYLEPYHYSFQFKKVPNNSPWNPEPCSAR